MALSRFIFIAVFLLGTQAMAQIAPATVEELPVWDGTPPGAISVQDALDKDGQIATVHVPTLEVFRTTRSVHPAAIMIMPGGRYAGLAIESEGRRVAEWLNERGITAFVLRYRFSPYTFPVPLNDAEAAIRVIRINATKFGIDPGRIGIWGFSAGGHLAVSLLENFDGEDAYEEQAHISSRPDFALLGYPVVSMSDEKITHEASRLNLLGPEFSKESAEEVSGGRRKPNPAVPVFIYAADDDESVSPKNAQLLYAAYRKFGINVQFFEAASGKHGFGLKNPDADAAIEAWLGRINASDQNAQKHAAEKPDRHVFTIYSSASDFYDFRHSAAILAPDLRDAKIVHVKLNGDEKSELNGMKTISQEIIAGDYIYINIGVDKMGIYKDSKNVSALIRRSIRLANWSNSAIIIAVQSDSDDHLAGIEIGKQLQSDKEFKVKPEIIRLDR